MNTLYIMIFNIIVQLVEVSKSTCEKKQKN